MSRMDDRRKNLFDIERQKEGKVYGHTRETFVR